MLHPILRRVEAIGGRVFTSGDWNLNLIGIRNPNGVADRFDDEIHLIYKAGGRWIDRWFAGTTDPGVYYLNHPINPAGTAAIVADRQYPGLWKLGKHRGTQPALVQAAPVAVHRDDNTDSKVDYDPANIQTGLFGINLHRSSNASEFGSVKVGRYSAGCVVLQRPGDLDELLTICRTQRRERGWDSFTFTLLNGGF